MDPALQVGYDKLSTAYFGTSDKKQINPAILQLLMQLLQSLMGGCTPAQAADRLESRPLLTRIRIAWAAQDMTGDADDSAKVTAAIMSAHKASTREERVAFFTALPSYSPVAA